MNDLTAFQVTCCSTADMPRAYFAKRRAPLAYFHFEMDGKTYPDDFGATLSFAEFYRRVDGGAMPVTSQVNVAEYVSLFEPILQMGEDVLHIALSSGISGSYSSAKIAETTLREKYPERTLIVIDSLAASSGYGLLVEAALDMRDYGASIEETAQWIEENKLKLNHWFFASELKHLKRGGRVSGAAALVGTFLNICPVFDVNDEGKLIPRMKVRGKKNVIAELVTKMRDHAQGGTSYSGKCYISHSACLEDAKALADAIRAEFKGIDNNIEIFDIGTVIGAHTGPGTVALFFWGDARSA